MSAVFVVSIRFRSVLMISWPVTLLAILMVVRSPFCWFPIPGILAHDGGVMLGRSIVEIDVHRRRGEEYVDLNPGRWGLVGDPVAAVQVNIVMSPTAVVDFVARVINVIVLQEYAAFHVAGGCVFMQAASAGTGIAADHHGQYCGANHEGKSMGRAGGFFFHAASLLVLNFPDHGV